MLWRCCATRDIQKLRCFFGMKFQNPSYVDVHWRNCWVLTCLSIRTEYGTDQSSYQKPCLFQVWHVLTHPQVLMLFLRPCLWVVEIPWAISAGRCWHRLRWRNRFCFVSEDRLPLSNLAVSSLACWHSALACQHSRAQHSLQCIFPVCILVDMFILI